jgi:hypothetical protein
MNGVFSNGPEAFHIASQPVQNKSAKEGATSSSWRDGEIGSAICPAFAMTSSLVSPARPAMADSGRSFVGDG